MKARTHSKLPRRQTLRWLRLRLINLVVLICFGVLLSGCIQYDVGIRFDSQTQGQLTQTIHLGDRIVALNPMETQQWLTQLGETTQSLGGSITQPDNQTLILAIPFNNGEHLVETFNRFFEQTRLIPFVPAPEMTGLIQPKATLNLQQHNRLLAIQNHLVYDIDLRDIVQPALGDRGIFSQLEALTLDFSLTTPWGIQTVVQPENFQNKSAIFPILQGNTARWSLRPGTLNHIDVIFWVPSPIGLGALAILVLVITGYIVKYGRAKGTVVN